MLIFLHSFAISWTTIFFSENVALKTDYIVAFMLKLVIKTGLTLQMAERSFTVLDYYIQAIFITVKPERKNFLDITTLLSFFY